MLKIQLIYIYKKKSNLNRCDRVLAEDGQSVVYNLFLPSISHGPSGRGLFCLCLYITDTDSNLNVKRVVKFTTVFFFHEIKKSSALTCLILL